MQSQHRYGTNAGSNLGLPSEVLDLARLFKTNGLKPNRVPQL